MLYWDRKGMEQELRVRLRLGNVLLLLLISISLPTNVNLKFLASSRQLSTSGINVETESEAGSESEGETENQAQQNLDDTLNQSQSRNRNRTNSLLSSSDFVRTKITSGLYWEDLPAPIFYENYIPIILEYKTPSFNKTEVTFNNWYNCTTESYPYALSCPIVFHLNSAIQNLHIDFESLVPGKDDETYRETVYDQEDYFDTLTTQSTFCSRIQSHFPSIYTNRSDVDGYLDRLKVCSSTTTTSTSTSASTQTDNEDSLPYYTERNLADYRYNIRFPFSKMETNFYDKFYRPVALQSNANNQTLTRLLASAVLSNSRTALQGSLLSSFYAERNRWHFAILGCQANKLPSNLVTETKLRGILSQLQVNLTSSSSRYGSGSVISIPLSSMSKYYSLPLTDCTHTEEELIVRILVPLTTSTSTSTSRKRYVLRTVHPVPYVFGDSVCKLKDVDEGSVFLYDRENHIAYSYDVHEYCTGHGGQSEGQGELCSVDISNLAFYGKEDVCVGAIFSGDVSQLVDYCSWECRGLKKGSTQQQQQKQQQQQPQRTQNWTWNQSPSNSMIFQRVSSNRLMIRKTCSNSEKTMMAISSVHLSCEHTRKFFDILNETLAAVNGIGGGAINFDFKCRGCTLFVGQGSGQSQGTKVKTFQSGSTSTSECSVQGQGANSNVSRSLFTFSQTLPWSLLKREKREAILKGIPLPLDPSDSDSILQYQELVQDLVLPDDDEMDWKSMVDLKLIAALVAAGEFLSGTATTTGTGTGSSRNNETETDDDAHSAQGYSERRHNENSFYVEALVGVLACFVVLLTFSQFLVMRKLREMERKSYSFHGSVPERVSYRRASPILLMEHEEAMDGREDDDHHPNKFY